MTYGRCALFATSALIGLAATPAAAQVKSFDIPAQAATSGIAQLGRQADVQIGVARKIARGKRTNAVRGQMSIEQALAQLLKGTGLTARATGAQTYTIIPLGAGAGAAQTASSSEEETAATSAALDAEAQEETEIVVTASKREERLQNVPSGITALTGQSLENQGVTSFRDYASLVPGLGQRDMGAPGTGTIILRGLNVGTSQTTNTAAFYFDDAPFSSSGFSASGGLVQPEPELADIERIEVLKGPQGTLYGASSLGGLVRIISHKPDPSEFSGNARMEAMTVEDGGSGYLLRGSINAPLVADQLAVRITGFYRRDPGFTDNVDTGTKDVNDSVSKGARIALGWTPTSDLTVTLVGLLQNIDSDGFAYQDHVTGTLTPLYGRRKFSDFFDAENKVRYRMLSATVDYDVGPGSLIGTASYVRSRLVTERDFTPPYAPFLPLFGYPAGTSLASIPVIDLSKKTAELRFVSERLGAFEFVAGGFYTHERTGGGNQIQAVNAATGTSVAAPFDNFASALIEDHYEEWAAFGNATFYLTDRLDITGGLRFVQNEETNVQTLTGALLGFVPSVQSARFTDSKLTYLATLRWRPTDRISAFLRAASGYRPGGPQSNPTPPPGAQTSIRPDTVWNYEAGLKASLLDDRLAVSASVYHIDWSNIQLATIVGGLALFGNGGQAKVDGFELELTGRPSRRLTIRGSLGYTDARITSIDPGASANIGAAAGDRLPLTPHWTAALVADQRVPLSEGVEAQVGATLRFESDKPSSFPGALLDPSVQLPEITTLDLRAGVRFSRYQLQLRAGNIFDRNGFSAANTLSNFPGQPLIPTRATLIRPRNFTLALNVDF